MEKSVVNIELTKGSATRQGNGENDPNCGWFYNWAECIVEIKTRALMEALSHKPSFVFRNTSIGISFETKNPFTTSNIVRGRWWNNVFIDFIAS